MEALQIQGQGQGPGPRGPPDTSIKREGRPSMASIAAILGWCVPFQLTTTRPPSSAVRVDGPAQGPRHDGCGIIHYQPISCERLLRHQDPDRRQWLFRVCEGGKREEGRTFLGKVSYYPVSQCGMLSWKGIALRNLGKEQTQDPGRSLGTLLPSAHP